MANSDDECGGGRDTGVSAVEGAYHTTPTKVSSPTESVTTPPFLEDMPQWKKDLIQRKKKGLNGAAAAGAGACGASHMGQTLLSNAGKLIMQLLMRMQSVSFYV